MGKDNPFTSNGSPTSNSDQALAFVLLLNRYATTLFWRVIGILSVAAERSIEWK
jgi:hypothetical protein